MMSQNSREPAVSSRCRACSAVLFRIQDGRVVCDACQEPARARLFAYGASGETEMPVGLKVWVLATFVLAAAVIGYSMVGFAFATIAVYLIVATLMVVGPTGRPIGRAMFGRMPTPRIRLCTALVSMVCAALTFEAASMGISAREAAALVENTPCAGQSEHCKRGLCPCSKHVAAESDAGT